MSNEIVLKRNGRIENFGKKMLGEEVLLDRVFPLVRLTGQLAYVSRTRAFPTPSHNNIHLPRTNFALLFFAVSCWPFDRSPLEPGVKLEAIVVLIGQF